MNYVDGGIEVRGAEVIGAVRSYGLSWETKSKICVNRACENGWMLDLLAGTQMAFGATFANAMRKRYVRQHINWRRAHLTLSGPR